jgi:sulfur-oxidizing protein SoxY
MTPIDTRRRMLRAGLGVAAFGSLAVVSRPAWADAAELAAAIRTFAGGKPVTPGRVRLEIATLIENGNAVPVTLRAESPMTAADHVVRLALFNERNPQREVLNCKLGPRAGRAQVATRIRLATSQQLVAMAQMSDGSVWSHTVDVIVTLAACIE